MLSPAVLQSSDFYSMQQSTNLMKQNIDTSKCKWKVALALIIGRAGEKELITNLQLEN